jgi:hypothetical protein
LGGNDPFSFESWAKAVRAGRTFVSNGPLLSLEVEGKAVGDEIRLPSGGGRLHVKAKAESVWPVHALEIIVNGRVVDSTGESNGKRALALESRVALSESSWIAARCASKLSRHQAMMGRGYLGAHTSPVYVKCGDSELFSPTDAVYMLTLLEGTIAYLDTLGTRLTPQRTSEMLSIVRRADASLRSRLESHGHHHH